MKSVSVKDVETFDAAPDYLAVFEALPNPSVLIRANSEYQIIAVSECYLEATGTRREDLLGKGIFDVFPDHPDNASMAGIEDLRASFTRVCRDKVPDAMGVQRYDFPRRDGSGGLESKFWSPINTPIIAADGTVQFILHKVRDITEFVAHHQGISENGAIFPGSMVTYTELTKMEILQRSTELNEINRRLQSAMEQLEARDVELTHMNARLHELDRAKSAFLSNMSHEIRTPLNAILGLAQVVLDSDLNPQQRDYLKRIVTSASTQLRIINQVLDYSRLEAGQFELEAIDFSLDDVLHKTSGLFFFSFQEKEIELVIEEHPHTPRVLNGDAMRLGQVLNNLVGNAIKFTERGEVRIKIQTLEMKPDLIVLEISIQDTGIGIAPEQLERLFQPFSQADPSTTRQFGGTGLGLNISMRLVEKMGGTLKAFSVLGKGSKFTFTVHLHPAESTNFNRSPEKLRGLNTLIVDDNNTILEVLANMLTDWNFPVTVAHSGEEALDKLREALSHGKPFELYLLDWKMPGLDGVELARDIRTGENYGTSPIVIMSSGFDLQRLRESATGIRLEAILEKPVTPSRLFDVLIGLQQGRALASPEDPFKKKALLDFAAPIRGARVLVVEDDETNRIVAREFLERIGLRVDMARNGDEGLDLIRRNEYAAVLMDLQMPGMDGFETTRRIQAMEGKRNLPVIAMTAAGLFHDRQATAAAGMSHHISKPIDIQELADVLLRYIPANAHREPLPAPREEPIPDSGPFALPGLDLESAVQRMNGNWALLRRVLATFLQDFHDAGQKLSASLAAGSLEDARRLVHALKGTSGTIGANALHELARKFDLELQDAGPLKTQKAFEAALNEVLEVLTTLPSKTETMRTTHVFEYEPTLRLLENVRKLLEGSYFVPFPLLEEMRDRVEGHVDQAALDGFFNQMQTFRYTDAKKSLNLIHQSIHGGS